MTTTEERVRRASTKATLAKKPRWFEKIQRYDRIVAESRKVFTQFLGQHQAAIRKASNPQLGPLDRRILTDDARRYASLAHEHAQILKVAGVEVICVCCFCELVGRADEIETRKETR